MFCTEARGLRVCWGDLDNEPGMLAWPDHCGMAYRIVVTSIDCAFPMPFARQSDAMIAMAAIEPMGDWISDWESIVMESGEVVRRKMLEALAW